MEKYAGKLSFYGSLSIQNTLPFGTPETVQDEVERRLAVARRWGGLIISPSHDMPSDIPLENIAAMVEPLKKQLGIQDSAKRS